MAAFSIRIVVKTPNVKEFILHIFSVILCVSETCWNLPKEKKTDINQWTHTHQQWGVQCETGTKYNCTWVYDIWVTTLLVDVLIYHNTGHIVPLSMAVALTFPGFLYMASANSKCVHRNVCCIAFRLIHVLHV